MPTGIRLDGGALKARRNALRLSQQEVARQLELHPKFYSRLESGHGRASLSLLSILEQYHGVDPLLLELVHPEERDRFEVTRPPTLKEPHAHDQQ